MMTSFIFLTLFAIMRTKKHGVVEHTTSSFFRTAVVIKCTKDMLQINAIFNLLTTYYRTVFVLFVIYRKGCCILKCSF